MDIHFLYIFVHLKYFLCTIFIQPSISTDGGLVPGYFWESIIYGWSSTLQKNAMMAHIYNPSYLEAEKDLSSNGQPGQKRKTLSINKLRKKQHSGTLRGKGNQMSAEQRPKPGRVGISNGREIQLRAWEKEGTEWTYISAFACCTQTCYLDEWSAKI
jgi:hypothetical protein